MKLKHRAREPCSLQAALIYCRAPFVPYYHSVSLDGGTMQVVPFGGHIIFNYLIGDRNCVLRLACFQWHTKIKSKGGNSALKEAKKHSNNSKVKTIHEIILLSPKQLASWRAVIWWPRWPALLGNQHEYPSASHPSTPQCWSHFGMCLLYFG